MSLGCKLFAFKMYTRAITLHLAFDFSSGQTRDLTLENDADCDLKKLCSSLSVNFGYKSTFPYVRNKIKILKS